jgi:hypothetical protein
MVSPCSDIDLYRPISLFTDEAPDRSLVLQAIACLASLRFDHLLHGSWLPVGCRPLGRAAGPAAYFAWILAVAVNTSTIDESPSHARQSLSRSCTTPAFSAMKRKLRRPPPPSPAEAGAKSESCSTSASLPPSRVHAKPVVGDSSRRTSSLSPTRRSTVRAAIGACQYRLGHGMSFRHLGKLARPGLGGGAARTACECRPQQHAKPLRRGNPQGCPQRMLRDVHRTGQAVRRASNRNGVFVACIMLCPMGKPRICSSRQRRGACGRKARRALAAVPVQQSVADKNVFI